MYKICNQILPKEITDEHKYTLKYHNFHTRKLDNKTLIIPWCKMDKK